MKKLVVLMLVLSMIMAFTACSSDEDSKNVTPTETDVTNNNPSGEGEVTPTVSADIPTINWDSTPDANAEATNLTSSGWNLYMFPMELIKSGDTSDEEVQKIIKYSDLTDYSVNMFVGWKNEEGTHVYAYTAKNLTKPESDTQVLVLVKESPFKELNLTELPYDELETILGIEQIDKPTPTEMPAALQAIEYQKRELEEQQSNSGEVTTESGEPTSTDETVTEVPTENTTEEVVEENTTKEEDTTNKKSKKKNK